MDCLLKMAEIGKLGFVKSIEEDEVVKLESESSESEEEKAPKKKVVGVKRSAEFAQDFKFLDDAKEYTYDSWSDVVKYFKKKTSTNLDEKIEKVRSSKLAAAKSIASVKNRIQKGEGDDDKGSAGGDDDDSCEEMEMIPDNIRVKKNKRLQKGKSSVAQTGKDVNKETREFFEDAPPFDFSITFHEMNLSRPLLKAVMAANFVQPTKIQAAVIPVALLAKDICGCAATGTGKTAAFVLPILERLLHRSQSPSVTRVLVVLPTRELAIQVFQVAKQLSQFTNIDASLCAGGLDVRVQEASLRKAPDIVIATPGRLIDHLQNTPSFNLRNIEILVLDEADRMLDEYFAEQMKEVIRQCSATRQTMLFSATMTDQVKDLAAVSLKNPVKIFTNSNDQVADHLRQEFIRIRSKNEGDREAIVAALLSRNFHDHCMVFMLTKNQTHRMHILLGLLGFKVVELHGNLSQTQRIEALKKFKDEEADILLATDLAARGLDIVGVKTVVNFTMPPTLQHYVHRVGRTARAGCSGRAVTLVGEKERPVLKEIIKRAKTPVKSRLIPADVVASYRSQIKELEADIKHILMEEIEEKELRCAELKACKVQTIIEHHDEVFSRPKRTWFQTHKERMHEANSLKLSKSGQETKAAKGKKSKKSQPITPEDRVNWELQKTMAFQAREAKRLRKPVRRGSVAERATPSKKRRKPAKKPSKSKSSFEVDLTDTRKTSVNRLRSGSSYEEKIKLGLRRKGGKGNKSSKSKSR